MLNFRVYKQNLLRLDAEMIVADSRNYLTATFDFGDDWIDAEPKTATFNRVDKENCCYSVFIVNNKCVVPWEVLVDKGILEISVQAGDLITTNPVTINVCRSGAKDGLAPTVASPGVYGYLLNEINQLKNLELIAEYVITEETEGAKSISISKDNDGNDFELCEAMLIVKSVTNSTGIIYADARINTTYISNLANGIKNGQTTVVYAKNDKIGKRYICNYEVRKTNTDRYVSSGASQMGEMFFDSSIKLIGIVSTAPFNAGTRIELYGRRIRADENI